MLLILVLFAVNIVFAQTTSIWEKSAAKGNYPSFLGTGNTERGFATATTTLNPFAKVWEKSSSAANFPSFLGTGNTERGFAFGTIGGNDRVILVDRKVSNFVYVLNAATGDSVGRLDTTGFLAISGGTLRINDAEVSSDGVIFACNLATGAGSDTVFRVYKWTNESATPQLVVSYNAKIRMGDKFTVTGSTADNSVVIWAVGAASKSVVKFTTVDNGATFTPTVITLVGGSTLAATPVAYPNTTGSEFYIKSNSVNIMRYLANGNVVDSVSSGVVGSGANALRYFELAGKKYLAVYVFGTGNENASILDVTNGLATATLIGKTPTLGSVANANGTGDVAFKTNLDNTITLYVLGTNNGIGSYKVNPLNSGTVDRMYLVDRKVSNFVYVLNAATGDSVGRLDTTGFLAISGGTLRINDAEVSSDGVIFACNLATGAGSDTVFRVYKWTNESATPQLVVSYNAKIRMGDKFTVTGSTADNSVVIWAVGAASKSVVKFTTVDNGATFTPTVITLVGGSTLAATPVAYPNTTGSEFYIKSNSVNIMRYLANGNVVDSVSSGVVGSGANALRYFELAGKKYLAVYVFGTGNENASILDVTNGLATATLIGKTPTLGSVANANGTGDVSIKANGDGTENIYVLGTNNGIGAFKFTPPSQVAIPSFTPAAGSYNNAIWVKISVATVNAKIYYTINGSTPDSLAGILFNATDSIKITDTSTTTIKAIAYASGMLASNIASSAYKINIAPASDALFPLWSKSKVASALPSTFSTGNYERGMAYGKVGGKDRIYVVARTGGPKILIFNALTGDSVGVLFPNPSITGGTFPLNFAGVSGDGILFAGNMSLDVSADAFKVYRWNNDQSTDTGKTVINYTNVGLTGARVGDAFSVFGKASDNTLTIFAAVSGKDKVIKFTTADNGQSFTGTVITLSNGLLGSAPSVALASDATLYVKSYGRQLYHYSSIGTLVDSVSSTIIGTDVTNIKYYERLGKKYIVCYYPNDGAPYTDERVTLVDVTNPSLPFVAFSSSSIGDTPNLNGTGAVDILPLASNNFLVLILGTNNGIAAFANSSSVVVSTLDTLFYGSSQNLLKNPFGNGFIVGTNSYGDIGKYQRFDLKKGDKLSGFKMWFGYKKIVGTPDSLWLVVKPVATGGKPDTTTIKLLVRADNIDTTKAGNTFILPYPITVNGPTFVGFEFTPFGNDTIALLSDKNGEGGTANRVWEKYSDGTYGDFTTTQPNWGLDIDLWIAAYYKKGNATSVEGIVAQIPEHYSLEQNYPNPFNPSTTIKFSLPVNSKVSLKIFNILGQQVAELLNTQLSSGVHNVSFNASSLSSGVYFYRLEAKGGDGAEFMKVKKLMLLK